MLLRISIAHCYHIVHAAVYMNMFFLYTNRCKLMSKLKHKDSNSSSSVSRYKLQFRVLEHYIVCNPTNIDTAEKRLSMRECNELLT